MSEVNANITVSPINLTVTPTDNQITITPAAITLGVYTAGQGTPGAAGNLGQLQFNNLGVLAGAANTQVTANGNVRFQNIGNLKINGGSNAYFLQTDGTGNLTWAPGTSNVSGSGTSAGANTQIQISDGSGNFTSGPGFTFDNVSNVMTVPGNAWAYNFIGPLANGTSNVSIPSPNGNIEFYVNGNSSTKLTDNQLITSNLKLTSNTVSLGANAGTISQGPFGIAIGTDAAVNNQAFCAIAIGVSAGYEDQGTAAIAIGLSAGTADGGGNGQGEYAVAIGYGAGGNASGDFSIAIGHQAASLQSGNNSIIINAANAPFQGPLSNAFYVNPVRNANTGNVMFYNSGTGEITYGPKPASDNISNGTSSVDIPTINGNVYISANGVANALVISGTGANLVGFANITGNADIGGNLSAANANLGNLVSANYYTGNGSLLTGVIAIGGNANYATYAGTVLTNAQPNITSVGNLTTLSLQSSSIELGYGAVSNINSFGVAIGLRAGNTAGYSSNANRAVAIGLEAGGGNARGNDSIGMGFQGGYNQGANSIALGYASAAGNNSISIGKYSLSNKSNTVIIGANSQALTANNVIVINATGANVSANTANSLFVKPIRDVTGNAAFTVALYYNPTTGEIGYK